MVGWVDGCMDGLLDGFVDGCVSEWMVNGWMNECTDKQMNGW